MTASSLIKRNKRNVKLSNSHSYVLLSRAWGRPFWTSPPQWRPVASTTPPPTQTGRCTSATPMRLYVTRPTPSPMRGTPLWMTVPKVLNNIQYMNLGVSVGSSNTDAVHHANRPVWIDAMRLPGMVRTELGICLALQAISLLSKSSLRDFRRGQPYRALPALSAFLSITAYMVLNMTHFSVKTR